MKILGAIVGGVGGLIGAFGGLKGYAAWREFKSSEPREQRAAIIQSFKDDIEALERIEDPSPEEKETMASLRRGQLAEGEKWRRRQGIVSSYEASIEAVEGLQNKTVQDEGWIKRLRHELAQQTEAIRSLDEIRSNVPKVLDPDRPTLSGKETAKLRARLEVAERLIASTVDDHITRGNGYFRIEEYKKALAAYEKAIEIDPNYAQARNNRGVVLIELNRPKEALKAFDKAIELDPKYARAHYSKGCLLSLFERGEDALESLSTAIDVDAKYADMSQSDPDVAYLREHPEFGPRYRRLVRRGPGIGERYRYFDPLLGREREGMIVMVANTGGFTLQIDDATVGGLAIEFSGSDFKRMTKIEAEDQQ
ncbi:MAG: tetratricopeptide repeat protein [Planctomycetota bacterium]|nr:tetratricopeptide repeat protein [Planctomycetota bacterium]